MQAARTAYLASDQAGSFSTYADAAMAAMHVA
jgi:hypothetical protein